MVKIRGKPQIIPNDGVHNYDAPPGCIAVKSNGDCSYGSSRINCCFLDGYNCKGGGPETMHCLLQYRVDRMTVAYKRIN